MHLGYIFPETRGTKIKNQVSGIAEERWLCLPRPDPWSDSIPGCVPVREAFGVARCSILFVLSQSTPRADVLLAYDLRLPFPVLSSGQAVSPRRLLQVQVQGSYRMDRPSRLIWICSPQRMANPLRKLEASASALTTIQKETEHTRSRRLSNSWDHRSRYLQHFPVDIVKPERRRGGCLRVLCR